jgi:LacI family transcriptional regulator
MIETPVKEDARRPKGRGAPGDGLKGEDAPKVKVNMREVARMADVSVATVSMVLSNNPRISRATQLRVRQVIDQVGYRPNRLAQSLSGQYTNVLAIVVPALRHAFADAYFGELISGITDRAHKMQMKLMLEVAKPDFIKEDRHIELIERRFVDGILCLGFNDRHRHGFLEDFVGRQYPMVVVNNYFKDMDLDSVVCDYRSGVQQVMNFLTQLGHRKIGFINGAPEAQTQRDLLEVYQENMVANGMKPGDGWVSDGRFTEAGGAVAAAAILDRHPDTTALFTGNDKMALGAMHYLSRRGLRVPQDVSVIGFDDLQHAAFVSPSLSTVHLPLYEVGVLACDKLVERVRGKIDRVAEVLPTHLILRESTALAAPRA